MEINANLSGAGTALPVESTFQLAQAAAPPRHAFGTLSAAESYIQRSLLDMENGRPRGHNGDIATIFKNPDDGLYYVYGPDNIGNHASGAANEALPGFSETIDAHVQRAASELPNASYVSGGMIINGFFHTLRPDANGEIHLGRPR